MLKSLLICGAIAFGGLAASGAQAADMPALFGQPEDQDAVPPQQFTFGTGWYLRGDLTASDEVQPDVLGTLSSGRSAKRGWGYGVGGGIGYKYSEFIRADLTGDFLNTQKTVAEDVFGDIVKSNLRRFDGLVNGYIDFGTWAGITPYIGGGVGFAGLRTDGSTLFGSLYTKTSGRTDYEFAWAGMAGFAYSVSSNMSVDIGYRYLDLGTYRSPFTGKSTDVNAHEIRAGIRYMIY